jgi:hypothetical protein
MLSPSQVSVARASAHSQAIAARGVERRRGMVNFLTWAFFMGQVFGRDGVVAGAHGAEADDTAEQRTSDEAAPAGDSADRSPSGLSDLAEDASSPPPGYASALPAIGGNIYLPVLERSGLAGSDSRIGISSGHAQAQANGGEGVSPPADASHEVGDGAPKDAQGLDLPPDGSFLDVAFAPHGLLNHVADALDGVPVVGNLLGSLVHTVANTVGGAAEGVGNLLDGVLGSDGLLEFEPAAPPPHDLQGPEGLTDYGIALELDMPGLPPPLLSQGPLTAHAELAPLPTHDSSAYDASHIAASPDPSLTHENWQHSSADNLA